MFNQQNQSPVQFVQPAQQQVVGQQAPQMTTTPQNVITPDQYMAQPAQQQVQPIHQQQQVQHIPAEFYQAPQVQQYMQQQAVQPAVQQSMSQPQLQHTQNVQQAQQYNVHSNQPQSIPVTEQDFIQMGLSAYGLTPNHQPNTQAPNQNYQQPQTQQYQQPQGTFMQNGQPVSANIQQEIMRDIQEQMNPIQRAVGEMHMQNILTNMGHDPLFKELSPQVANHLRQNPHLWGMGAEKAMAQAFTNVKLSHLESNIQSLVQQGILQQQGSEAAKVAQNAMSFTSSQFVQPQQTNQPDYGDMIVAASKGSNIFI